MSGESAEQVEAATPHEGAETTTRSHIVVTSPELPNWNPENVEQFGLALHFLEKNLDRLLTMPEETREEGTRALALAVGVHFGTALSTIEREHREDDLDELMHQGHADQ